MSSLSLTHFLARPIAKVPITPAVSAEKMESWADVTEDEQQKIVELKKNMLSLPSGMYRPNDFRVHLSRTKSKSKGGKGKKDQAEISRSYLANGSRPLMHINNHVQVYVANLRASYPTYVSTSTTVNVYGQFSFALSQFSDYTQYTGLFDQYMITELEIWVEPQVSQGDSITNVGEYVTAIDVDDANAPTTYAMVEGKQNSLVTTGQAGHYHKWVPHIALAAYNGAFTSFVNEPPCWLDAGSSNILFYGIKMAFIPTSTIIGYNVSIRARALFKQAGV